MKVSVPVQLLNTSPSIVTSGWLFSASCTHVEPERPGIHITNGVVSRLGLQVSVFEGLSACRPAEVVAADPPLQKSQRRHLHHRLPRKGMGEHSEKGLRQRAMPHQWLWAFSCLHQSAQAMALASPCMSLWQVRSPSRLQLGPTLCARVASIV